MKIEEELLISADSLDSTHPDSPSRVELTLEGYQQKLRERQELLEKIEQNKIELQEARAFGDLSENAEYDAARDNQARLNYQLKEVEAILKNHVIIEKVANSGFVVLTSKVTFEDLSEAVNSPDRVVKYTLVGSAEADPHEGKISSTSPLGSALFGTKVGETVEVYVPRTKHKYQVRVLKVE